MSRSRRISPFAPTPPIVAAAERHLRSVDHNERRGARAGVAGFFIITLGILGAYAELGDNPLRSSGPTMSLDGRVSVRGCTPDKGDSNALTLHIPLGDVSNPETFKAAVDKHISDAGCKADALGQLATELNLDDLSDTKNVLSYAGPTSRGTAAIAMYDGVHATH
jgi:hypothetical protein